MALLEDDELYSGYNDYPNALSIKDLEQDEVFQQAVKTSYGRRPNLLQKPGTSTRLGTSSGYREGTGFRPLTGFQDGIARPMTAVKGAGYSSQKTFDPLNQAQSGYLETKEEISEEDKVKKLEKQVMHLFEESCFAYSKGDYKSSLEKAKEASNKEKTLIRLQGQSELNEGHNIEMTYAVLSNLAHQYCANEMYAEAMSTYQAITKNRMFTYAYQLKVNMGNIHFKLGQYTKALKMYQMALDQVPSHNKELKLKIMHNISILFIKNRRFEEACSTFEDIMREKPDFKTGLHLLLTYQCLNKVDKMKIAFRQLLEIPLQVTEGMAGERLHTGMEDSALGVLLAEAIRDDSLARLERQRVREAERAILLGAKLIAPLVEETYSQGYDWCVSTIQASSQFGPLANELEMSKATSLLKQKDVTQAVATLKALQKKDSGKSASAAHANLAFIYLLQGELDEAEKSAEEARNADGYNSAALVNLGSCYMYHGELEKAQQLFAYAYDNDTSCVEALYNLGLVQKQLGNNDEALECFMKLESIIPHQPQILFHLATLLEATEDIDHASQWYLQLLGIVPTDSSILQRIGEMYQNEGDKQLAYQYHLDSYRYYPCNLSVLEWLGARNVELGFPERAAELFNKASLVEPDEPRWRLLVASCIRRAGDYHGALRIYKDINKKFPENIECLKFLVRLCGDLNLPETNDYIEELKKAEKAKELRERIGSSRPGSRRSSGRSSRESPHSSGSPGLPRGSPAPSYSRGGSGSHPGSGGGSRLQRMTLVEQDEPPRTPSYEPLNYSDPVGPMPERPRTSAGRRALEDEFGDEPLGNDLLPE